MDSRQDRPEFHTVDAPEEWSWTATGTIRYVVVTRGGATLGYLWAATTEPAADFVPAASAGAHGRNASIAWAARLRAARAEGATPLTALERWTGTPEDETCGTVPPEAPHDLPTLQALLDLAAQT